MSDTEIIALEGLCHSSTLPDEFALMPQIDELHLGHLFAGTGMLNRMLERVANQ